MITAPYSLCGYFARANNTPSAWTACFAASFACFDDSSTCTKLHPCQLLAVGAPSATMLSFKLLAISILKAEPSKQHPRGRELLLQQSLSCASCLHKASLHPELHVFQATSGCLCPQGNDLELMENKTPAQACRQETRARLPR